MEAQLEAVTNELLPLKAVPGHLAVVANTVERMERAWQADAKERADRDEAQDKTLEKLTEKVNRSANLRTWVLGLVPFFVALVGVAGLLLTKGSS